MARLFARKCGVTSEHLLGSMEYADKETLRKARVRVDTVSNKLWRMWLADKRQQGVDVWFYIHCDSSSQWRGLELWTATIDIVGDHFYFRRTLPLCECLGKDAIMKGITLMWESL